jgi:hypothetical protein
VRVTSHAGPPSITSSQQAEPANHPLWMMRPRRGEGTVGRVSAQPHLAVYRFECDSAFEGGLLGALQRIQLDPRAKVIDALFVMREPGSGALAAIDLRTGAAGATLSPLLDFRLDAGRRRRITRRTVTEHAGGVPRELVEFIAATLEAGAAMFVVLYTGPASEALDDAIARAAGRLLAGEACDAGSLAEAAPRVRAAVRSAASAP